MKKSIIINLKKRSKEGKLGQLATVEVPKIHFNPWAIHQVRIEFGQPCVALYEQDLNLYIEFLGEFFSKDAHYAKQWLLYPEGNFHWETSKNLPQYKILYSKHMNRWVGLYKNTLIGIKFYSKHIETRRLIRPDHQNFLGVDKIFFNLRKQIEEVFEFNNISLDDVKKVLPPHLKEVL